jgi:alpha-beta hydrolase superfamily lysophospholipase
MSYRNDVGSPPSPDHEYHLGASEWQDVEAGIRYGLAHGARHFVLYGFSMGGSIVESLLYHSRLAGHVRAVVLDSPALDWNAVFDLRAGQAGLPGPITALAKDLVAWRLGLGSLNEVNHLPPRADFKVRTLLFQGTGDTSWNANPSAYDARLRAFLTSVR